MDRFLPASSALTPPVPMAADDANDDDDCAESAFDSILLYLTLLIIFIVGLGLGAESTVDGFKTSMKKPQAVACGLASQFGWMPLSAFVMCKMASLDELTSIGVILVGDKLIRRCRRGRQRCLQENRTRQARCIHSR